MISVLVSSNFLIKLFNVLFVSDQSQKNGKESQFAHRQKFKSTKRFWCDKCGKERLKETEGVLLNIFDMMKKFVDQKWEDCVICEFSTSNQI